MNIPIQQSASVVLAGQTGGAVRVVLEFFVYFLFKQKRKRE